MTATVAPGRRPESGAPIPSPATTPAPTAKPEARPPAMPET